MAGFDASFDQSKLNIHLIDITQRKPHIDNTNPTIHEQDTTREVKFRGQPPKSPLAIFSCFKHDIQQYLSFILIWFLGILVLIRGNLPSDLKNTDFLSVLWVVLMAGIASRAETFKRNIGVLQMMISYNLLAADCLCIDWVTYAISLYVFVNMYTRLKNCDLQKKTFFGLGVISVICHASLQTLDAGFLMLNESFLLVIAICYVFIDLDGGRTESTTGSISVVNA